MPRLLIYCPEASGHATRLFTPLRTKLRAWWKRSMDLTLSSISRIQYVTNSIVFHHTSNLMRISKGKILAPSSYKLNDVIIHS
jgi:hypothetical protein